MNVGDRIMRLRKQKGYSRTEFAEKIGIPYTTLRNYEKGVREPGHSFLIKMANEFSVSTDYLLCLAESPEPSNTKKSPAPAETEAEEVWSEMFSEKLGKALVNLGLLREGEDLTPRQRIVLEIIIQLIKANFGQSANKLSDSGRIINGQNKVG